LEEIDTMKNSNEGVRQAIERVRSRRRMMKAWSGFWNGLCVGTVLWLSFLLVYKFFPIPFALVGWSALVFSVAPLVGLAWGVFKKESLGKTALWVDQKVKLKERLSTALEFEKSPQAGHADWNRILQKDAENHMGRIKASKLLPWQLPAVCRYLIVVLLLGTGLGLVPEYRSQAYLNQQEETENIKDTGRHLEVLARKILQHQTPIEQSTKVSLEDVSKLGEFLVRHKLTRRDALRDIADMTQKLKEDNMDLLKNPALKRMAKAARRRSPDSELNPEAIQRKMDELEKKLGRAARESNALDELKKKLSQLKQKSTQAMSQADGGNSEAEQAKQLGLSLPSLESAIEAMKNADPGMFLKDMDLALEDLEELAKAARKLKNLKFQLMEIGKDLGEQLDNGQALIAMLTLKKMVRELRESNLPRENFNDILKEVMEAIDPSLPYGEVPEHLLNAMRSMKQNKNSSAADSLEKAADELKELMERMGDCESLEAALGLLGRCQMAIGNCKGFGQCPNPKAGNGGKPGQGVGTWAEDGNWLDEVPLDEYWDNSGIDPWELESKGLTDREAQQAENTESSLLKGKFSPGGSMPSITLKGISIKGSRSVEYEEVLQAAQSDAESALNQERVPRAYQSAVRDYFDQ